MNYLDNIGTAFRRPKMINLWLPAAHTKPGHVCFSEEDITRLPDGQVAMFPTETFINEDLDPLATFIHNGNEVTHQELLAILQSFYLTLAEKRDTPPLTKDFTPSLTIIMP